LRWINQVLSLTLIFTIACEDEQLVFENPLDLYSGEVPALVFFPDSINISYGDSAEINLYILEAEGISGIHAQVAYDTAKLSINSVTPGTFLDGEQKAIFIKKNKGGLLDIFSYYLGSDSSVTGTGLLATVTFKSIAKGNAQIKFTTQSELVDPSDQPIEIRSLGQGVINAQ
jgi:hypothetical protein